MRKKTSYKFTTQLWEWPAEKASWFFLTLPTEYFQQIKHSSPQKRGFGSVKVEVTIGKTTWQTSVFPSSRDQTFILPVKQKVRTAEMFGPGDTVTTIIKLI